ncbi:hypothetical protein LY76DRAFT_599515 [Colletotrichum caudatum]|nr:hypothetical protein LY76DRAFT_599515 [Colletotrichum caudatum]
MAARMNPDKANHLRRFGDMMSSAVAATLPTWVGTDVALASVIDKFPSMADSTSTTHSPAGDRSSIKLIRP